MRPEPQVPPSTRLVTQARLIHRASLVLLIGGIVAWSVVTAIAVSLLALDRQAATGFLVRDAAYLIVLLGTAGWLRHATGRVLHVAGGAER